MDPLSFNQSQASTGVEHSHRSSKTIWTLVIALVVLAGLYLALTNTAPSTPSQQEVTTEEIAPGQVKTTAPQNALISGFPEELIIEASGEVSESYTIAYADTGKTQMTARFMSSKKPIEVMDAYKAYFEQNGWEMVRYANYYEVPTTYHYAKKGEMEANVTFTLSANSGTDVVVSYVSGM